MTRKQLLILVVALVVLAGGGAWLADTQRTAWKKTDTRVGQKLLPGVKLEDVVGFALRNASGRLTLVRRDDVWAIEERADFPADIGRVRELLLKLIELKIVQTEPVTPAQRARLDLLDPDSMPATGAGTSLELKDRAVKVIAKLLLGKQVATQTAASGPSADQAIPTGRYVMQGKETGSVALVSDSLGTADAKPEAWLSKNLIRAERVKSVAVTGADGSRRFTLSRESESQDWKLAGGANADLQKAQDAVGALQGMTLDDVVTDPSAAAAGMTRPVTVRAETFDGLNYTLRIGGKAAANRVFIALSVTGGPPSERKAKKGETAEEKKKQDKTFADSRSRLLKKLEWEKQLERWTYLVSKSTVEPLLHERAQLLPEKKKGDAKKR